MNAFLSRVRSHWMVAAIACVVLAGVLVTVALSHASDRVSVVRTTHSLRSGQVFAEGDFTVTEVAIDPAVHGLVPANSMSRLVGRVAAADLPEGALVQRGDWRDAAALLPGERAVGALLKQGRVPASVARGDRVDVSATDGSASSGPVAAQVLDVVAKDDGSVALELAVSVDAALTVAQWAANDVLVVVLRPSSEAVSGASVIPTTSEVTP